MTCLKSAEMICCAVHGSGQLSVLSGELARCWRVVIASSVHVDYAAVLQQSRGVLCEQ